MPAKNSIKEFVDHAYYHLYNRGVEKRIIFVDEQDYVVFLSYLKIYLLPKDTKTLQLIIADPKTNIKQKDNARKLLRLNNFSDTISLIAYCLMPNHFHFLVKQTNADTIDRFMNSLFTRYSMYFNRKYKRVGPLFQGLYKAVFVNSDEQLLHLTRYIHQNPKYLVLQGTSLQSYTYSSYPQYLGIINTNWVKPQVIFSYFNKHSSASYQLFVENVGYIPLENIKPCLIDGDDD